MLGGGNIVSRAVELFGLKFPFITRVEDLQFHAIIGQVASLVGGADSEAVVRAFSKFEIKSQHKVTIGFLGHQITTTALGAIDNGVRNSILHQICDSIAIAFGSNQLPAFERLPVKETREIILRMWLRKLAAGHNQQE